MAHRKSQSGFTLIEVLVALVIVAVLATGLLRVTGDSVRSTGDMEQRTIATIIASNYLVRLQQAGGWPEGGELSQTVTMAGRSWRLRAHADATAYPLLRRLSVHVAPADADDDDSVTLVGFVGEY